MSHEHELIPKLAIFDFIASGEDQITLQEGDEVQIYEEIKGWYKGKSLTSNAVGIFPCKL